MPLVTPRIYSVVMAIAWLASHSLAMGAEGEQQVRLAPGDRPEPTVNKVVFEVSGKMLSGTGKDSESATHDLKAIGNFLYEERIADHTGGQSLRYYRDAQAEVAVDGRPSEMTLRDERRYVAVTAGDAATLRSIQGPFTRDELELIEVPGGSHLVNSLLSGTVSKVGDHWTHDDNLIAQLLNLDSVTVNEVQSELRKVTEDQAQMVIQGKVIGNVEGVVSQVEVDGKYTFDRGAKRVTWLALSISENREIGTMTPGLDVQSRVRMLVEPTATPHLDPTLLETLETADASTTELLEYQPANGGFMLNHDRHWQLYSERPEAVVFRLIDDGQVLAHCTLRALPPTFAGHKIPLSEFQGEVRKALGSAAQQTIDAQESELSNGLRQLRVALVGEVAKAPIHWVYYQLNDAQGQRVTAVFTMSGERTGEFGVEDLKLVSSISFTPLKDFDSNESKEPAASNDVVRQTAVPTETK